MSMSRLLPILLLVLCGAGQDRDAEIREWIERLGHPSIEQREQATDKLSRIGEPAVRFLARAEKKKSDPELRFRARQVRREILRRAFWSRIRVAWSDPRDNRIHVSSNTGRFQRTELCGADFAFGDSGRMLFSLHKKKLRSLLLTP